MNKMRAIISKISEGKILDALSRELGIRDTTVRSIIDSMVHQGYLGEIRCGSGCSKCLMDCGSLTSSKVKMYAVTDKGMEYVKQRQG